MDIQLRKQRNQQAAYMFMKRLMKAFGEPTVLTINKAPVLLCAFKKQKQNVFYIHTEHCAVKYLNNLIKQDHRHIKQRFVTSAGCQHLPMPINLRIYTILTFVHLNVNFPHKGASYEI